MSRRFTCDYVGATAKILLVHVKLGNRKQQVADILRW